jgi:hypothetical protein
MKPQTLRTYRSSRNHHSISKSAFSAYLQHLSGCIFLLRRLIALPILSPESMTSASSAAQPASAHPRRLVEQPEILLQLTREWGTHKESEEHLAAVERSRQSDQTRLSIRLYRAQRQAKQAAKLSRSVEDGTVDFLDLSAEQQAMVEDYDCRRGPVKVLETLLAEQASTAERYRGAGVVLQLPSRDSVGQPV